MLLNAVSRGTTLGGWEVVEVFVAEVQVDSVVAAVLDELVELVEVGAELLEVVDVELEDLAVVVLVGLETEDEDPVELEAFELVVEEEEVVDLPLDSAMYATPAAAAIITITSIANTVGAIPRLLLTIKLVLRFPQRGYKRFASLHRSAPCPYRRLLRASGPQDIRLA